MNAQPTPDEVARLQNAHREKSEQELEAAKSRLAQRSGALGEDERAGLVERLRSAGRR
jgi:hypothetical protein